MTLSLSSSPQKNIFVEGGCESSFARSCNTSAQVARSLLLLVETGSLESLLGRHPGRIRHHYETKSSRGSGRSGRCSRDQKQWLMASDIPPQWKKRTPKESFGILRYSLFTQNSNVKGLAGSSFPQYWNSAMSKELMSTSRHKNKTTSRTTADLDSANLKHCVQ